MCSTTPQAKCKLGIDATKKLPDEGFKRHWQPLIKMDSAAKARVETLFNLLQPTNVFEDIFYANPKLIEAINYR